MSPGLFSYRKKDHQPNISFPSQPDIQSFYNCILLTNILSDERSNDDPSHELFTIFVTSHDEKICVKENSFELIQFMRHENIESIGYLYGWVDDHDVVMDTCVNSEKFPEWWESGTKNKFPPSKLARQKSLSNIDCGPREISTREKKPVVSDKFDPKHDTIAIIKPGFINYLNEILICCSAKSIEVKRMVKCTLDSKIVDFLYEEHQGKNWHVDNVEYVSSGPVYVIVFSSPGNTCTDLRDIVKSIIRPNYANKVVLRENVIHASDSQEAAQREFNLLQHLF